MNEPLSTAGDPTVRAGMLTRPGQPSIAYRQTVGAESGRPGVVFLHGFMSDMGGTKAVFLDAWCRDRGVAFLRFDQTGHGASEGAFTDGTIGGWARDTVAVIEALTEGPQILVGSSMGGWLALLAALKLPQRVAGLVGLAAAPDFTESLWRSLSPDQQAAVEREGAYREPTPYAPVPYTFTRDLFRDGRENSVLGGPIPLTCPVRLLQGQKDDSVPWQTALTLADRLTTPDVEVLLIKDGDHRLSEPAQLARLGETLAVLLAL